MITVNGQISCVSGATVKTQVFHHVKTQVSSIPTYEARHAPEKMRHSERAKITVGHHESQFYEYYLLLSDTNSRVIYLQPFLRPHWDIQSLSKVKVQFSVQGSRDK
jgi:hypothetical protein